MRRWATPLLAAAVLAVAATPSKAESAQRAQWRFPVKGPHGYGDLEETGYGVERPDGSVHKGQDVLADCGTPLVAVHRSRVRESRFSPGYGHYLVLDARDTRLDFVYGHLTAPGPREGTIVRAGNRIGLVGSTGGTPGGICHLHFEIWNGPWFGGGERIDPLPRLRRWDRYS